jgi:PAS domain S-box-containing protein
MSENPRYHVLYMEDDAAQVRLVQKCLERMGYCVDVVLDGLAGLQCFSEKRYDAVVVDQTMPLRSGLEVIRDMAEQGPLPPTIMVTGTGNEQVAVEAMKLGVSDYLVKDLEGGFVRLLPVTIERAINQHRLVEEKRLAEENLRLFRSFADASAQGFGMGDFQRKVQYVNPALCRILGEKNPEAIIGKDYRDYYPKERWQEQSDQVWKAVVQNRQWTGETLAFTANGTTVPILQSVFPICNDQGEPICYGTTVTDISERKHLEQELVQAQKLEAIGQLAAGIAHEINTPIQYIGDNACFLQDAFCDINSLLALFDLLLKSSKHGAVGESLVREVEATRNRIDLDYLTIEIPKAIQQSLEGVERVASIVGAMKEFSHPGRKEKQAVDLNKAIQSTLTISRNEWKYVAEVVTDLDPSLPAVYCLPTEINQVMLNIVVNAAHAVGQAIREDKKGMGVITVRTRRDGDCVEIRIEDTGTGIPEAIRTRVFDPFFTTKDVGQGSGQGLAIARSIIVDRHGGTIRFESELKRGTTFIIRLPIDARTASQREAQAKGSSNASVDPNVIYASPASIHENISTNDADCSVLTP